MGSRGEDVNETRCGIQSVSGGTGIGVTGTVMVIDVGEVFE